MSDPDPIQSDISLRCLSTCLLASASKTAGAERPSASLLTPVLSSNLPTVLRRGDYRRQRGSAGP